MSRNGSKAAAPAALETPAGFHDDAVQALSASFYEIEADSWRRSEHRGNLFALITSPWRRSFEKRQADWDSGTGHLPATIKPKIVRYTIILSTNNLFLLTPPTSLSRRFANPAVINLSIQSSRSLPNAFRVIFFFGVEHVRRILL